MKGVKRIYIAPANIKHVDMFNKHDFFSVEILRLGLMKISQN